MLQHDFLLMLQQVIFLVVLAFFMLHEVFYDVSIAELQSSDFLEKKRDSSHMSYETSPFIAVGIYFS